VIITGRIRTMDPAGALVGAMLVEDDRIVATGTREDVRRKAPAGTIEHEALGVVVPGFLDAHLHTLVVGLERRRLVLSEAGSIAEVCDRIEAWLAEHPGLTWAVVGAHFHAEDLAEGRLPDRHDLDRVSGGTALYLDRRTHDAIVNSRALELAGIDASTPDPVGGHIERDADGRPTGVLIERPAADLVFSRIPEVDAAERRAALLEAQSHLHSLGITSASEPGLVPDEIAVYEAAHAAGELTLRTMGMPLADTGVPPEEFLRTLEPVGVATGHGDDVFRRGPLKIYLDGAGGFGTALISRPWPGTDDYRGNQTCSTDTFQALVDHCARHGWSVAVHAVGDSAVTLALDCFERAHARWPIDALRFSVMHAYLWPSPADMARAAALGVLLSSQPAMQWRIGAGIAAQFGAGAVTAPLRQWLDAGAVVAGGSDGPDFPMAPLFGMWQARSRIVRGRDEPLGRDEALDAEEALMLYTTAGARYCFADADRGRLAPGHLADWVELAADPVLIDVDQLAELAGRPVLRTVIGGRVVHGPALAAA
jgi:predicted amidohydrolase YtcJ